MATRSTRFSLAVALLTAAWFAGCAGRTTIGDITHDPGRFANKEITVSGQVSDTFGVMGDGVFQLDDGSGHIWVFSQNFGLPENGARVRVTGRVQQGFSFGGRTLGLVMVQTRARD